MRTNEKLLMLVAIFTTWTASQIASAKTITVHSTADDGPGSLRQALVHASFGDKINIVVNGTITLESGELLVDKSLTIKGPDSHGIISGNSMSRVFHITPGTIVTLDSLTITNGAASIDSNAFPNNAGGGIYSDHAKLTVTNCTVNNNSANLGGGVFSNSKDGGSASVTVNNSTISDNFARSITGFDGAYGGGIFSGGGFFNTGPSGSATLALNNSTVSGNSAESAGGGIFNDGFAGTALLTITNTVFTNNSADFGGGAIYNNGDSGIATAILNNATLTGNSLHTQLPPCPWWCHLQ